MDKEKAQRFAQYLVNKYGEDGAKKKILKILKTGKVDEEDLKGFAESEQKLSKTLKGEKTPKKLHGSKLDYIKTLKHQCADDEELVYYKKGGIVDCGCKKKNGGEVEPKKECKGGVAKFKAERMLKGGKPKVVNGSTKLPMLNAMKKADDERKERQRRDKLSEEDYFKGTYGNSDNPPDSKAMAKSYVDKQTKKKEEGGVVAKFKKARCGSKMKKK